MCGRYALFMPPHKLKDLFGTDNLPNFPPRYNAAPLQEMPVIVKHRMGMARWGFVPPWGDPDDKAMAAKMINARSETVAEKASFKEAWAKGRRCLIPANGFYEWYTGKDGVKRPYYIHDEKSECLAFAGLWAKQDDLVVFTVLTKEAEGSIAKLHHRMPVLIAPAQAGSWFAASPQEATAMMQQSGGRHLSYYAVDAGVGKVANDTEALIRPLHNVKEQFC